MNPQLQSNNYLLVPNFLSAQEADSLAQWMFALERDGGIQKDTRWGRYNFFGYSIKNALPFVKLLIKKIPEVSKLSGVDVLPTYAYTTIYKNNAELIRHVDRDACEISLTVSLSKDHDWPICVKTPTGEEVCVQLNPGDALMYKGCESEHWRQGQYQGQNFVQVFMHYVNADGDKAYAFFDQRWEK